MPALLSLLPVRRQFVMQARRAVRLASALVVATCVLMSLGCQPAAAPVPSAEKEGPPPMEATVLTVETQQWPLIIRSQGVLVADETASVGTKVAGSVSKVCVELGDPVQLGDPLIELDANEFKLQVAQAEAQLAQARSAIGLAPGEPSDSLQAKNSPPVRQEKALWESAEASLRRAKELQLQNAIASAEVELAEADERVAEARYAGSLNAAQEKIALIGVREAELALARERLENAVVVAPFDGYVQQRQVSRGDFVQVGDSVVTLVRTNPLYFRGTVPENHAQKLALGQEVRLQIEGIAEPQVVEVTRISPSLDQASRSLRFEAKLENSKQQFRTGIFAQAEIIVNPQALALVVPNSAVVEFAGAEKVWKVVDGMATEQEVLTGQRRPGGIEILRGLNVGDVILADGSQGRVARVAPLHRRSEELASSEESPAERTEQISQQQAPSEQPEQASQDEVNNSADPDSTVPAADSISG